MKSWIACASLVAAALALGCGVSAEEVTDGDAEQQAASENTGTVQQEMKWDTDGDLLQGDWACCEFNGRLCRCRGSIVDCR